MNNDMTSDATTIPELRTCGTGSDDDDQTSGISSANGSESLGQLKKIPQSMYLNDCSGVHIGPLYNCIDPVSVRTPPPGSSSPSQSFESKKPPPMALVQALLTSNREISDGEMDVVSKHLGYTWRQLGRLMGYTEGELDNLDSDSKRLVDKCYSLLAIWRDREASKASVANLTRLLMSVEAFDVVMHLRP